MAEAQVPAGRGRVVAATAAFLAALAILLSLGTWQVQRLHWKEQLLAEMAERRAEAPLPLADIEAMAGKVEAVPAEGMLAPDSYDIEKGADRAALLTKMETAQAARLAEAWDARAEGLPYKTPEEALVMASIVEKETGVPEERGRVASVFLNRLEQGMKLQTDPTVIYGITKGEGVLGRGLRQSELRKETPYNTYVIDGLPPGPIANPGLESIRAALNPDKTEYLFFVADGTGGHAFAETLEEHNRNVEAWRKIEAERAAQNPEGAGN